MAIIASNGTPSDVETKLGAAAPGDTVTIPAGTFTWTSGVSTFVAAGVTLQGAGTSATGGGDQTVITDNISGGASVLALYAANTGTFRFTGITVQSGSGGIKDGGTIHLSGPGTVRVDHCHLNMTSTSNYKAIMFSAGVFGVMDHCIMDFWGTNGLYFYNGRTGGGGDIQGHYEWTQPTDFGGTTYFYVEDNIINGNDSGTVYATRVYDSFSASKIVTRFNTLAQSCLTETHDTGHAPNDRGCRSQEVYGNLVTSTLAKDPNFDAVTMGNGTALVWGNSWNQVYKNIYLIKVVRKDNNVYTQIATPNGWGYAGNEFNGTGSNWDGGTVNGNDTTKGYPCLDQPGRGAGDLLSGDFPSMVNASTGTIHWPNQALEPIYLWNNTGSIVAGWGGNTYSNASAGRVVADRDFYMPASGIQTSPTNPFNGTTGCGWGTLANRPTTCTVGVGYFATDQGSWNTSSTNPYGVQQNGASGVLYKCNSTNVWTLYYTPYTYPHPLQGAAATGKIISIPASHNFGSVAVGSSSTYDIPVSNTGDTTLNVSAVSYPSGFSGPTGGFTVGAGATVNKLATFTPLVATTYSGNIVFTSDADSGSGTMAATGIGVTGGGGGHGRGHKKGIVARRH